MSQGGGEEQQREGRPGLGQDPQAEGEMSVSSAKVDQDDASALDADALMADVARPAIGKMLVISIGIHVALILLTSIRFIALCFEHGTLDPRAAIKVIKADRREKELEKRREADRKKTLAVKAKKKAGQKAKGKEGAAESGGEPKTAGEKKKPKVLRDIEAKSKERPTQPDVNLDELDELE